MSMLTEQTKKLRKTAYEVENIKNDTIGLLTRDSRTLADAVMQMRDAADTIENLRNRLTETCHDLSGTGANGEQVFHCSECGCVMSLYDLDGANVLCTNHVFDYPRYCPNCGRMVI